MDAKSFTVYIKTKDIYIDIAKDVERRFDTSKYELETPLSRGKKVIGLMKDGVSGTIMTEFAAWRPKIYGYLLDNRDENKKAKDKKKVCHKAKIEI